MYVRYPAYLSTKQNINQYSSNLLLCSLVDVENTLTKGYIKVAVVLLYTNFKLNSF